MLQNVRQFFLEKLLLFGEKKRKRENFEKAIFLKVYPVSTEFRLFNFLDFYLLRNGETGVRFLLTIKPMRM